MDEGRGIVLPITHSGNWDVAGLWVARSWGSMTTVAERLKPESLYEKFVAYRESLGMEILPLTGCPAAARLGGAARAADGRAASSPLVGRPRPVRQRGAGDVLRRDRHGAGRARPCWPR